VDVALANTVVDTVDRTLIDACSVVDVDARFGDHVAHGSSSRAIT
jgi:hypothetical protein